MIENILKKLSEVSSRFEEIESLLSQPGVTEDQENYINLTKEYSEISPIVQSYKELISVQMGISEAETMQNDSDAELRELAQLELIELKEKLIELEQDLKKLLLPKDPDDSRNVFLEVRAGTGGDEASLFAADLFSMYQKYSDLNSWKFDILSVSETGLKGVKEAICNISGLNVFSKLKFESGVHSCLLYTSPSPRDGLLSRMPSSA